MQRGPVSTYVDTLDLAGVTVRRGDPVIVTRSAPYKRDTYETRFRRAQLDDTGQVIGVEIAPDQRGHVRTYRPERITTP